MLADVARAAPGPISANSFTPGSRRALCVTMLAGFGFFLITDIP